MPFNFSKDLFQCPRGKMTFNVNFCKEKYDFVSFIEFGGGAVDKGQGPFTIILVDSGSPSQSEFPNRETYSSNFMLMCCLKNEILKLSKFRELKLKQLSDQFDPNDILLRRYSWNVALQRYSINRIPKVPGTIIIGGVIPTVSLEKSIVPSVKTRGSNRAEWEKKTNQYCSSDNAKSSESSFEEKAVKRKRFEYNQEERNIMVKYIVQNKAFNKLRDYDELWKEMVSSLPHHTWQSLKEHFRRKVFPFLSDYDLDEDILAQFQAGMAVKTTGGHDSRLQEASGSDTRNKSDKNKVSLRDSGSSDVSITLPRLQTPPTSPLSKVKKIPTRKKIVRSSSEESDDSLSRETLSSRTTRRLTRKKASSYYPPLQKIRTSPRKRVNVRTVMIGSDESSDGQREDDNELYTPASDKENSSDESDESCDSNASRTSSGLRRLQQDPSHQKVKTSPRERKNVTSKNEEGYDGQQGDDDGFCSPASDVEDLVSRETATCQRKLQEASGSQNKFKYMEAGSTSGSPALKRDHHALEFPNELNDPSSSSETVQISGSNVVPTTPMRPQLPPASPFRKSPRMKKIVNYCIEDFNESCPSRTKLKPPSPLRKSLRMKETVQYCNEDSDESCRYERPATKSSRRFESAKDDPSTTFVISPTRTAYNKTVSVESNVSSDGISGEQGEDESLCVNLPDQEDSNSEESTKSHNSSDEPGGLLEDDIPFISLSSDGESDPPTISRHRADGTSPRFPKPATVEGDENFKATDSELAQSHSEMDVCANESDTQDEDDNMCDGTQNKGSKRTLTVEHHQPFVSENCSPSLPTKKNRDEIHLNNDLGCRSPRTGSLQALEGVPSLAVMSRGTSTTNKVTSASSFSQKSCADPKFCDASMQTDPVNIHYEIALSPSRLMSISVQTDSNFPSDADEVEQTDSDTLITVPLSPSPARRKNSNAEDAELADFLTASPCSINATRKPPASPKASPITRKAMKRWNSEPDLPHRFQENSLGRITRAAARKWHGAVNAGSSVTEGSSHSPGSSEEESMDEMSANRTLSSCKSTVSCSPKEAKSSKDFHLNKKEVSLSKETSKLSLRKRTISNTDIPPLTSTALQAEKQKDNERLNLVAKQLFSSGSKKRSAANNHQLNSENLSVITRAKARLEQRTTRTQKKITGSKKSV